MRSSASVAALLLVQRAAAGSALAGEPLVPGGFGPLAGSDPRRKSGDDCAARVYIACRYDPATATVWQRARYGVYRLLYGQYPPGMAQVYVWESRLPVGTGPESAYTDRARIVVPRRGAAEAGRWVGESHDIYSDFQRIIGGEPPRIAGISVMTDTDDTGERAVAYSDAITLAPGSPDR